MFTLCTLSREVQLWFSASNLRQFLKCGVGSTVSVTEPLLRMRSTHIAKLTGGFEINAEGFVLEDFEKPHKIIEFPGRKRRETEKLDSIFQSGTLDGQLIRVGGKDETVPVYLEEADEIHRCTSNRTIAKSLAPYLYDVIRVRGTGKWNTDDFGNWVMEDFRISDFEKLDTTPLKQAVARLREIKSDLHALDDPIADLERLRKVADE